MINLKWCRKCTWQISTFSFSFFWGGRGWVVEALYLWIISSNAVFFFLTLFWDRVSKSCWDWLQTCNQSSCFKLPSSWDHRQVSPSSDQYLSWFKKKKILTIWYRSFPEFLHLENKLFPLSKNSPLPCLWIPENHHSAFCFHELHYFRYIIKVDYVYLLTTSKLQQRSTS